MRATTKEQGFYSQIFKLVLPIAILKDSSLVSAIGLAELAYAARTVAGATAVGEPTSMASR